MSVKALVEAIAGLVIFLTLAGLGLFKVPSEEPTVEAGLRAQAEALMAEVPNPPVLTVKGRVIAVEGRVQSHAERRQIESALRGITGVEEVRASLTVLPEVDQFRFALTKDSDGLSVSGHVALAATATALGRIAGQDGATLDLARGAPFAAWDEALLTLAEAAGHLSEVNISLAGTEGHLTGTALWPSDAAQVEDLLRGLPEAVTFTHDLTVIDDGAPFLLVVEKGPRRGASIRGKLPPDLLPETLTDVLGDVQGGALAVGPVDPGVPGLADAMVGTARVLASADQGVGMVTPGAVVLTELRGGGDLDVALETLRASLSDGYQLDVSRLPPVTPGPFWLRLDRTDSGLAASGLVPRDVEPADLGRALGADVSRLMQSDYPDEQGWMDGLAVVQDVFADLARGKILLEAQALTIEGLVPDAESLARVKARLAAVPQTLQTTRSLRVIDDGAPFLLVVERDPRRGVALRGVLPPDLSPQVLTGLLGAPQASDMTVGPADPAEPGLSGVMTAAARVMAGADQGVATVSPGAVVLSGLRGDGAMETALTDLRAALPEGYRIAVSRLPHETPRPVWIRLERLGEDVSASGLVPRDVDPAEIGRLFGADVSRLMQSDDADDQGWADGLTVLQGAFDSVLRGSILLEEHSVTLDALLPDPDTAARVEARLAALPQADRVQSYIDIADDGIKLDARLIYAPETGLQIMGGMPADMTGTEAADALSLPAPAVPPKQDEKSPLPRLRPVIDAVSQWLGEAEELELVLSPQALTLRAVVSPGVDLPQVEALMRGVLAPEDTLDLTVLTRFPAQGTQRDNAALGAPQVFLAGYWLPVLDFAPSVAECARQSGLAAGAEPVRFLSGQMRLDARSIRGVNALSAVARVCVLQGGLSLVVEGHSDNFGGIAMNRDLSQRRAQVVATEIAKRGVPEAAMTVVGYGPDRPVADNATAEGRALNRRITLSWQGPGTRAQ